MTLESEIKNATLAIKTDSYSMSIGELSNLYRNNEIDLHPQFQRFFRWTPAQKTRLIESILLGIPLPPIFVAQRADGVWDVVDGLQRLSAILQFTGELKKADGSVYEQMVLEDAQYLPSLRGKRWDAPDHPASSFNASQRLFIKRAKLDVNIVLKESDEKAKYELFQRLNTGGSQLSDQEVRNCLLIMVKPSLFSWFEELAAYDAFRESVALSDRAVEERFDLELALRFVVFRRLGEAKLRGLGDLGDFLTREMMALAEMADPKLSRRQRSDGEAFRKTFDIIASALQADAFRRYEVKGARFVGGFLISAFEAVALGLGYNAEALQKARASSALSQNVKDLWRNKAFLSSQGSGVRASSRLPKVLPLGRGLFRS
jgi:Protein of unknown function DUF262